METKLNERKKERMNERSPNANKSYTVMRVGAGGSF